MGIRSGNANIKLKKGAKPLVAATVPVSKAVPKVIANPAIVGILGGNPQQLLEKSANGNYVEFVNFRPTEHRMTQIAEIRDVTMVPMLDEVLTTIRRLTAEAPMKSSLLPKVMAEKRPFYEMSSSCKVPLSDNLELWLDIMSSTADGFGIAIYNKKEEYGHHMSVNVEHRGAAQKPSCWKFLYNCGEQDRPGADEALEFINRSLNMLAR